MKQKKSSEMRRIAEYFVSGGAWFWSGYLLIVLLDDRLGLFWANLIGNAIGITLNFALQHYWVFKTQNTNKLASAAQRYIIYTVLNAFLLNYLILLGLKEIGIAVAFGQFIASGFFTVWNYYWYKVWVFADKKARK